MTVHVEMGPRITFCGKYPVQMAEDEQVIADKQWQEDPSIAQHATCETCLLRMFMLGDYASAALAKIGRVVEVHNAPAVPVLS